MEQQLADETPIGNSIRLFDKELQSQAQNNENEKKPIWATTKLRSIINIDQSPPQKSTSTSKITATTAITTNTEQQQFLEHNTGVKAEVFNKILEKEEKKVETIDPSSCQSKSNSISSSECGIDASSPMKASHSIVVSSNEEKENVHPSSQGIMTPSWVNKKLKPTGQVDAVLKGINIENNKSVNSSESAKEHDECLSVSANTDKNKGRPFWAKPNLKPVSVNVSPPKEEVKNISPTTTSNCPKETKSTCNDNEDNTTVVVVTESTKETITMKPPKPNNNNVEDEECLSVSGTSKNKGSPFWAKPNLRPVSVSVNLPKEEEEEIIEKNSPIMASPKDGETICNGVQEDRMYVSVTNKNKGSPSWTKPNLKPVSVSISLSKEEEDDKKNSPTTTATAMTTTTTSPEDAKTTRNDATEDCLYVSGTSKSEESPCWAKPNLKPVASVSIPKEEGEENKNTPTMTTSSPKDAKTTCNDVTEDLLYVSSNSKNKGSPNPSPGWAKPNLKPVSFSVSLPKGGEKEKNDNSPTTTSSKDARTACNYVTKDHLYVSSACKSIESPSPVWAKPNLKPVSVGVSLSGEEKKISPATTTTIGSCLKETKPTSNDNDDDAVEDVVVTVEDLKKTVTTNTVFEEEKKESGLNTAGRDENKKEEAVVTRRKFSSSYKNEVVDDRNKEVPSSSTEVQFGTSNVTSRVDNTIKKDELIIDNKDASQVKKSSSECDNNIEYNSSITLPNEIESKSNDGNVEVSNNKIIRSSDINTFANRGVEAILKDNLEDVMISFDHGNGDGDDNGDGCAMNEISKTKQSENNNNSNNNDDDVQSWATPLLNSLGEIDLDIKIVEEEEKQNHYSSADYCYQTSFVGRNMFNIGDIVNLFDIENNSHQELSSLSSLGSQEESESESEVNSITDSLIDVSEIILQEDDDELPLSTNRMKEEIIDPENIDTQACSDFKIDNTLQGAMVASPNNSRLSLGTPELNSQGEIEVAIKGIIFDDKSVCSSKEGENYCQVVQVVGQLQNSGKVDIIQQEEEVQQQSDNEKSQQKIIINKNNGLDDDNRQKVLFDRTNKVTTIHNKQFPDDANAKKHSKSVLNRTTTKKNIRQRRMGCHALKKKHLRTLSMLNSTRPTGMVTSYCDVSDNDNELDEEYKENIKYSEVDYDGQHDVEEADQIFSLEKEDTKHLEEVNYQQEDREADADSSGSIDYYVQESSSGLDSKGENLKKVRQQEGVVVSLGVIENKNLQQQEETDIKPTTTGVNIGNNLDAADALKWSLKWKCPLHLIPRESETGHWLQDCPLLSECQFVDQGKNWANNDDATAGCVSTMQESKTQLHQVVKHEKFNLQNNNDLLESVDKKTEEQSDSSSIKLGYYRKQVFRMLRSAMTKGEITVEGISKSKTAVTIERFWSGTRHNKSAAKIQSIIRGYLVRKNFLQHAKSALIVQYKSAAYDCIHVAFSCQKASLILLSIAVPSYLILGLRQLVEVTWACFLFYISMYCIVPVVYSRASVSSPVEQ